MNDKKVDAKKELSVEEQARLALEQYEKDLVTAKENFAMWNAQAERLSGAIIALKALLDT